MCIGIVKLCGEVGQLAIGIRMWGGEGAKSQWAFLSFLG